MLGVEVVTLGGRPFEVHRVPGEGPLVVFVNGCGVAMEGWLATVDELRGRRALLFNRPGYAVGDALPRFGDEVADLARLIERESPGEPVVLVGHSMAGFHIEGLARLRPDLVAGAVLVDPTVEFVAYPKLPVAGAARLARLLLRSRHVQRVFARVYWLGVMPQTVTDARIDPEIWVKPYREQRQLATCAAEGLSYPAQAHGLVRLRRRTAWHPKPIVVLSAHHDGAYGVWGRRHVRWARRAGADLVQVQGSGHMMLLDRPALIADHINTVARATLG